jgi:hypothetical protein
MPDFLIEQALYRRDHEQPPRLRGRSPGFRDEWLPDAERLIVGFGERSGGVSFSRALFATPLNDGYVAVVQVADLEAGPSGWRGLAFHCAALTRSDWQDYVGDPFVMAGRLAVDWTAQGELPVLSWPAQPLPARTLAQVQAVLRRVKAHALREDEDPEAQIERTVENSESPALLGGAQVLVDGGKLMFVRPAPDQALVEALWTLLPNSLRPKIWPATFAFSNALGFDVVVVPRAGQESWDGYTTEEQAADYPAGSYELALQTAAEANDQAELDAVFTRRTSSEMLRLTLVLVGFVSLIVIAGRLLTPAPPILFTPQRQTMVATGIVGVAAGDPWSALSLYQAGKHLSHRDQERQP